MKKHKMILRQIKLSSYLIFILLLLVFLFASTQKKFIEIGLAKLFKYQKAESLQAVVETGPESGGLKYILLWNSKTYSPFYELGNGQQAFIKHKCRFQNCFVTSNRYYFNRDLTKFHAIAFNGRTMYRLSKYQLPHQRSMYQKYIFMNLESNENYPICSEHFDGFFNWTSSYRLDSDIPYSYLDVRDKNNIRVGPHINMQWIKHSNMDKANKELVTKLKQKNYTAAWFVSNCYTKSKREEFVDLLQTELKKYNHGIDIYGRCGNLECPQDRKDCNKILEKYYFYMALENSFSQDYVTEKVLRALNNNAIPIVFGSVNYTRFLPPNSYIQADKYTIDELAKLMVKLMKNPSLYQEYFRWTNHYTITTRKGVLCDICERLNKKSKMETKTIYHSFREWWHPSYRNVCEYRGLWNYFFAQ